MYLKSLTLKGFKSFPDRTRLEFGPGVSVVVGPNGSGKSNLTDAVLWALGEQSPVAVRGQSMQDLIFGGAPGRQASRGAEVELVLDDGDGLLALGVPEVSIVRRLERAGEGEYRLAGARCRLVDVIDVLSDTGLGREMHSVISQGRVEAIVTSKPHDRRLLIEEAAGLGKHRKRRRRAQLKLDRTQDNLDRALDVEREARSRLRPLKRQAEAAELHARLQREMTEVLWELAREELRGQLAELDVADEAASHARAHRAALDRDLAQVAKRRQTAEEALARRSAQREELSRRCFVAQSAAERVSYRLEATRTAAGMVEARLGQARGALAAANAQAAADVPDGDAEERISRLEASLSALARDRQAELERAIAQLRQQLEAADEVVRERDREVAERRSTREAAEARLEESRRAQRAADRTVEATRREAARIGAELAAVNQFLRSHAAAANGARTLADGVEVDPGYELAVTAALDGRLAAAVVADRATGEALLDRAGSDGGRALVLNLDTRAAEPASPPPIAGAQPLAGHVRGGESPALVRALLAGAWVVDSLQAVPERFPGTVVTRGGRVWTPQAGELRQAPALGEDRVLAQRNHRQEVIAASEAAVQAEANARVAVQSQTEELTRYDGDRERAVAALRTAVSARDDAAEERRRLQAQIDRRRQAPDEGTAADRRAQLTAELAAERGALARAEQLRADRARAIDRLRGRIGADEALLPLIERLSTALTTAGEAIAAHRATFDAALASDREAGEHVADDLRQCAAQEVTLHGQLHRAHEAVTEAQVRRQRTSDRTTEVTRQLKELAEQLALAAEPAQHPVDDEHKQALIQRRERLVRRREQLGPVNPLAEDEYAAALAHVEELEGQRTDLETALRELRKLINDTDRQISETFEHTFTAAARNFEHVTEQLFPGGKGRLRLVTQREGPARVLGAQPGAAPGGDGDSTEEAPDEDTLGVEIEITPAGKDCKRLSLLSGGEKSLTALAFLFSVFLARPCPFYILDEVEAALDDLNIDRFLALLRAYSEHAQFIVVTHQRRTMEAADSLYGVSMGADGISKVISRRLPADSAVAQAG